MAHRTDGLKQHQADMLNQCQRMRASRVQVEADQAAVRHVQAARECDLVKAACARHASQAEHELKQHYADLQRGAVDIQRLLSVRAYEQQAAQERAWHADQLERSECAVKAAVERRTATERERLACARRSAKLEELQRVITHIHVKGASQRLERLMEGDLPRLRQRP